MRTIPVLRGWTTLLLLQLVCALVHTLAASAAPQSPFQHTVFLILKSVEEHTDTSSFPRLHSTLTLTMIRQLWTAPMFQVCLWLTAVHETTSGPLQQDGRQALTTTTIDTSTASVTIILVQQYPHLLEKIIFANQKEPLAEVIFNGCGTLMTLCGTHRGVEAGAHAVIVVVRGSQQHWVRKWGMTLKWGCAIMTSMMTLEWINLKY